MVLHNPKYVGYWKVDNGTAEIISSQSLFLLFVDGEGTDDNWINRKISGDMQDFHGLGRFEGELKEKGERIIFKKTDYKEEGKKGLSNIETRYNGLRFGKSFAGTWELVLDGASKENGKFVLDEYGIYDSKTLFDKDKNSLMVPIHLVNCEIKKLQIRYSENISKRNGLKA